MLKKILINNGGVYKYINAYEMLFQEGDPAFFYYWIVTGAVKLTSYNDKGKEMIHGIFTADEGFGAPALLGNYPYCFNAEALENTQLVRLEKSLFLKMLEINPETAMFFLKSFSKRLQFKTMVSIEINCHEAEQRIMSLLNYLKEESNKEGLFPVPLTRQTIANIIGLRVETVIRAVKSLAKKQKIQIINRKLYL